VVIDTWRWDALGANGAARAGITPELDALVARGGVRFSRAIASSPWTEPSVATLLTGQYPTIHGAYGRLAKVGKIRHQIPTIAEILSAAGYRTLAVTNATFLSPRLGFDRGFEVYDYLASTNRITRRARETVDAALEHLRNLRHERPVFLFLHLFDPHLAYDPPPPWHLRWTEVYRGPFAALRSMRKGTFRPSAEKFSYVRALYDGEVSYSDHELGRFFRQLEEVRPGRERMIVVTADHGEEFGEHGGWEHGHAMYRELVQVPLLIVPPAAHQVDRAVVDAQVRLLDLLPTLLEAAAVEPPAGLPGTSLFSWFEGSPLDEDLVAYSERVHLGASSASLRDGRYALVYYPKGPRFELFDQRQDPAEAHDLGPSQPGRVEDLRQRLEALAASLGQRAAELGGAPQMVDLSVDELEQLRALGYLNN
jgi:arylsulfatase A-like enzyme